MRSVRHRIALLLVLTSSVLVVGCGAGASVSSTAGGSGPGTTVVAKEFSFEPRELRVAAHQPVTIRLKNDGKLLHDWTVEKLAATDVKESGSASHMMDGPGGGMGSMMGGTMGGSTGAASNAASAVVHVAADAGKTAEVTFTAEQPGTYTFYCTVAGHREAGMQGTIIVGG